MITYVKRKDIDVTKYDTCIEKSIQSRIYAFSWYLDIVTDNWDALVLDNYKAVMPLPCKTKFGLKYISQPYFCQQLGVFSFKEINQQLIEKFLEQIPKYFLKVTLNICGVHLIGENFKRKKNYILNLNYSYNDIFNRYSKTRKQRVKSGQKENLVIKETELLNLIDIHKKNYDYKDFSMKSLQRIAFILLEKKKAKIFSVYKNNNLLGGGLFVFSKDRIIYLYAAFSKEGRTYQAASFLIDFIINKYSNTNVYLDFEGGNLPNIETFFKSFGTEIEYFYNYSKSLLTI